LSGIKSEVGEEGPHLSFAHLLRVANAMKQDELPAPPDVGLTQRENKAAFAEQLPQTIEKFWRLRGSRDVVRS
jgi:hypothetical protein